MYRKAGSGTTSWKRRADRVDKQWSSLAEQKKALEKAEKRLEERKQEESSSSSESTKPPKKSGKLGPRLGEVKEEDPPDWSAMEEISIPFKKGKSLEKDQADKQVLEKGQPQLQQAPSRRLCPSPSSSPRAPPTSPP